MKKTRLMFDKKGESEALEYDEIIKAVGWIAIFLIALGGLLFMIFKKLGVL